MEAHDTKPVIISQWAVVCVCMAIFIPVCLFQTDTVDCHTLALQEMKDYYIQAVQQIRGQSV